MFTKGTIVEVYEDPLTRQRKEGNAKVIEHVLELDPGVNQYKVNFVNDDPEMVVVRTIVDDDKTPIQLTEEYWDCECEIDYIHNCTVEVCEICKAERDDQPNSRVDEVTQHGFPLRFSSDVANVRKSAAKKEERPEIVLSLLRSSSDGKTAEVIAVKYGEKGYHPTTYGRQTWEWVVETNERLGIDDATALAFETCSLFGRWENYEEIKRKMEAKVIHV